MSYRDTLKAKWYVIGFQLRAVVGRHRYPQLEVWPANLARTIILCSRAIEEGGIDG